MDLSMAVERRPGSRVAKRWWEKDILDLERMWTAAQEAEQMDGEEETDGMEGGYGLNRWEDNVETQP